MQLLRDHPSRPPVIGIASVGSSMRIVLLTNLYCISENPFVQAALLSFNQAVRCVRFDWPRVGSLLLVPASQLLLLLLWVCDHSSLRFCTVLKYTFNHRNAIFTVFRSAVASVSQFQRWTLRSCLVFGCVPCFRPSEFGYPGELFGFGLGMLPLLSGYGFNL